MTVDSKFDQIESAPLSAELLSEFEYRKIPAGYLLATPHQRLDQVLVVGSGRLRVYLEGENRSLTLSFLESGDIYTTHTPTYVESVEASAIWLMDTAEFSKKLTLDPSTTPAIMQVLGRLLSSAVGLLEDLAFREVPARLARFLIGLAERRGEPTEQGLLVQVDLNRSEIASLLGSTRQTVSSLLNQWERDGVIQQQGRQALLICSIDTLKKYLDGDRSNVS
jgi:CRP-like cAMP-binding protein